MEIYVKCNIFKTLDTSVYMEYVWKMENPSDCPLGENLT